MRARHTVAEIPTTTGKPLYVYAVGSEEELNRPCVDCDVKTGSFCDHCLAEDRMPDEHWCRGQHTPFCTKCDRLWDACRFCRGESSPPQYPCVDCGRMTMFICISSQGATGDAPLCAGCSEKSGECHLCRGVSWTTPPAWGFVPM